MYMESEGAVQTSRQEQVPKKLSRGAMQELAVVAFTEAKVDDDDGLGWRADALCAQTSPEAFFPEKGGSTRDAKKVCGSCAVRSTCLEYALINDERFGIWGGLSERERRKLRRKTDSVVDAT
jgi:WhiB family redox-sensing transcriptional regulator